MIKLQKKTHSEYKLAIGASGGGTTFEAIAKKIKSGKLKLKLCFIFADRECGAIKKAEKLGIRVIQRQAGEHIDDFHARVIAEVEHEKIDFVALCGYLRLFPIKMHDSFLVLNSHPGAIPEFGGMGMYGTRVHQTVLEFANATNFRHPFTYSTVHVAVPEYDMGPIMGLAAIELKKGESAEDLASRLLPVEHKNYIAVLERLANDLIEYQKNPINLVLKSEIKILTKSKNRVLGNN